MVELVYRIEDGDGYGAYSVCADWGDNTPYDLSGRHPEPYDDSGLRPIWSELSDDERDAHSFGFRDEAQMRAWFHNDDWLHVLKEAGCHLTVWEAEEVHVGYCQAIFRKDKARMVATYELIEGTREKQEEEENDGD